MKRYFEYTDAVSNKFWEINLKGKQVTLTYGRIGIENPAKQSKSFASTDLAKKYYEKKLREWFKLIYEVVFGVENGPRIGFFVKFLRPKQAPVPNNNRYYCVQQ